MTKAKTTRRWGVLWRQKNKLDGVTETFMWAGDRPVLFSTRAKARVWIEQNYGFIRDHKDLRSEPHGWRMPQAARVDVMVEQVK